MTTQALSVQPNLINVFEGVIGTVRQLVVNARDLHSFLQVGKRFASWIQERIGKYEFVENEDFVAISQNREIGHGRGKVDYHLTLDMAKELSMVENNDKGREARRYFIAMEKKALAAMIEPVAMVKCITQPQYDELAKTVRHIAKSFKYPRATWWIWELLRQQTGIAASHLPVTRFEEAKQYLKAIESDCNGFHQLMFKGEAVLFARYKAFFDLREKAELAFFRQNANLVPVEMQGLLDQLK